MIRSSHFCDECDAATPNAPHYGCVQCDDCAERAHDRWLENYYGEPGPPSLREQQIEALKLK